MRSRLLSVLAGLAGVATLVLLGWLGWAWWDSRLPGSYDVMDYATPDLGGGPEGSSRPVSVGDLTAPPGKPDHRFRLTAQEGTVTLTSGKKIDAWTFDGHVPGPEIRVRRHELVEITLVNKDIDDGVSIHWHGVDVPNAEDGVAGVTQDALRPGQSYTYRFQADQAGTFWYHTHEDASKGVERGLFGAFVVLPAGPDPGTLDLAVPVHTFSGGIALGSSDRVEHLKVKPKTPVRLRLINTDSVPRRLRLTGAPFSVAAVDGVDLDAPAPSPEDTVEIGSGGRYDLVFETGSGVVALEAVGSEAALVLSPTGEGEPPPIEEGSTFDVAARRGGIPSPISLASEFDRTFDVGIGRHAGFIDGRPGYHWSVNGQLYPRTPMFMVDPGDLVLMKLENDSGSVHPMHLHGHHFLVLSRNGKAVTPWWADTVNMHAHERFEIAFRATNPGLWMFHCHNLQHAADGLTMHVAYDGVTTPFRAGDAAHNHPE